MAHVGRFCRHLGKLLVASLVLLGVSGVAGAVEETGPALISHGAGDQETWAVKDLRNVFLGKVRKRDDGSNIVPVLLNSEATDLTSLFRLCTGKSPAQFRSYWKLRTFSGKGHPPQRFATDLEVIDFVARTPGAIGLIADRVSIGKADVRLVDLVE